ncbi:MAG TPA: response regulator transcription factor [Methylophilaceae bacterium]|nr:response regulator transcription factor [Methylophilaceae bacterium]HQR60368.1 response regulator transcription factor [Methylophilaceae bacterium]
MSHALEECPSLLLVDDDDTFRQVLAPALKKRGFDVSTAADVAQALALAEANPPEYAVVDLKMPGQSGLVLVKRLKELDAATRIVMLTGFASIATAVEAVKLGATHYLAKPADADEIVAAFYRVEGDAAAPLNTSPLSVERLEWEHIQRILAEHDGNISATARALDMHRRTLQRKLGKNPKK